MQNRQRSGWKSAVSLIGVILAGILLNLLGTRINEALGLPLFIDDIGTILSAVLGGYIPCITVGFFTNIISGIADSYSTYYCIISVLIAVAAVSFAEKMLMYGKEASNRKQEIDRQHYTIPNQRPKDKHCGKI